MVLLWSAVACSGVDTSLVGSGEPAASGGTTSVFVHGDSGCGSGGAGSAASGGSPSTGASAGGGSSLPGDFSAGASGSGGAAPGGGTGQGGQLIASGGAGPNAAGSGGAPAVLAQAFLFSEYVEGSSTYKALEITALEDSTFDGCRVAVYFNGATSASGSELEGTLLAGESYVLCSSSLSGVIGSCDRSAGLTFNGDDAIALECDGAVVDVIGQIGFDPGTAWGTGDVGLVDHTLRRSCSVSAGDVDASNAFEPAAEWSGHAQDSFEDLGVHSCAGSGVGGAGGQAGATANSGG